jgi:hypothetical protein
MIRLEILSSPDKNVISQFIFYQNQIYLGSKGHNLAIGDKGLLDCHAMIEVVNNDLLIHPQKGVEYYLIDGKRSTTIRKIKTHQLITISSTQLKVLYFEETNFKTKKNILDNKFEKLINNSSPLLPVIEQLGQTMK